MRTLAILPVKSFGAAKQRLADALGAGSRQALAQAMFSDVLSALRRTPGVAEIVVVTADRAAESASSGDRVRVLRDTAQAGQSEAALIGIRHGLVHGYDRVVLVPGDTPLLRPRDVEGLIAGTDPVLIVPDRHGTGTNALLLAPPEALAPAFGEGSFARHVALARATGVEPRVAELASLGLDVDTPGDLAALAAALAARPHGAPRTRTVLERLAPVSAP
jgi:2-phospho-L-lactate/phosphoenolpyruvate guanylyltransferase